MVVCCLLPRFELLAAVGDRRQLLGAACALAPEAGREQLVGEVSGAAEAVGVRRGMRLGEALARCPELRLLPPDPDLAAGAWEAVLRRLEGIGAAVEPGLPGEAWFEAAGLEEVCGGSLEGVLASVRHALGVPCRLGVAPSRFCASAAAHQGGGSRRSRGRGRGAGAIVPAGAVRAYLAPLPVSLLTARPPLPPDLPNELERLGVGTLGALADLPGAAVADRFGRAGIAARRLARGEDDPLRPRCPPEPLAEHLDLPEEASGPQLERVLGLLVDRLLTRPERRERTLRRLRIAARLAAGGAWRREVPLREASADAERLRLALAPRLAELPAPASRLGLAVETFGPRVGIQLTLEPDGDAARRARLSEAARQARAVAGRDAVLRILEVDPGSHVPERRAILTPFAGEGEP